MLDYNQKAIDSFFTRRRHKDSDFYFSSQFCFCLTKETTGRNSIKKTLLTQTIKGVEGIYRGFVGFDMEFGKMNTPILLKIVLMGLNRKMKENIVFSKK